MGAGRNELLVWMDMEMTGLDPEKERIIEVATIITDGSLAELAAGPELVVKQADEILEAMDAWNKTHHGGSGLIDRVKASEITDAMAEEQILAFINAHAGAKERPVLAGNSIHQDRRFIRRYMPKLDARLHYRMVDVSTIKELARRWYPSIVAKSPLKKDTHRALDDVRDSIDELRFYRTNIFVPPPTRPSTPPTDVPPR
jgi:oligoribonuclease